jgi:hypothetical protein
MHEEEDEDNKVMKSEDSAADALYISYGYELSGVYRDPYLDDYTLGMSLD